MQQGFPGNWARLPGNSSCRFCSTGSAALLQRAKHSTLLSRRYFCNDSVIWDFFLDFQISVHARACLLMLLTGCKHGRLPTEMRVCSVYGRCWLCFFSFLLMKLCFSFPSLHMFIRPLILFHSAISSSHPNVQHNTLSTQFCRFFTVFFSTLFFSICLSRIGCWIG